MSSDYPAALAPQAKQDRHIVSWTQEEDDLLREQVAVNGPDNWTIVAARFMDKTGRQCRRRWLTYLSTDCKKGGWSQEEDILLCEAQKIFGNRWTEIAKVVSGRTDNAVKNRFSTLCKKRAKHHIVSKENNDSHVHPRSKKIMVEPSANKEQIRYGGSHHTNNFGSNGSLATIHSIDEDSHSRPPLSVLTQNFTGLSCFPAQCHINSSTKPSACEDAVEAKTNSKVEGTFLRRDDPKLTSLLQQAELLSSVAIKAYSENRNHDLEHAWKELQNYLIRTWEGGSLRSISGMDFLLNNFSGLFKDLDCVDAEIQLSWRETDAEDSQTSSEMTTGCSRDEQGSHADKYQLDQCDIGCNEGQGHEQEESPAPVKFVFKGEMISSTLEVPQNNESQPDFSKPEFDSPVKTIPPFHSFTEEIPSPKFSSSEKKFLQFVLRASSSPKAVGNRNETPCKRDPESHSKQSHLCKRVLLNSLSDQPTISSEAPSPLVSAFGRPR